MPRCINSRLGTLVNTFFMLVADVCIFGTIYSLVLRALCFHIRMCVHQSSTILPNFARFAKKARKILKTIYCIEEQ